ncbi:MAG: hypothetical protein KDB80_11495 [Planctomycetes bacterium]|nr:hypothetical protein [Planctomycetota bacterium]
MRAAILALLAALPTSARAQVEQAPFERSTFAMFAADLPKGWRPMTPDEMFALEDSLPYVMRVTKPGSYFSIGDVDAWLANGFDGRALFVSVQSGEIPIVESSIEVIRETWSQHHAGVQREFLSGEITQVGKDAHPTIRCRIRTPPVESMPAIEAIEYYVPTAGHMLILSFRSWQDDFDRAVPLYSQIADSLTFPRPPRGAEELSDRLFDAAIIGGLVGLALIVIRMMVRRPTRQ